MVSPSEADARAVSSSPPSVRVWVVLPAASPVGGKQVAVKQNTSKAAISLKVFFTYNLLFLFGPCLPQTRGEREAACLLQPHHIMAWSN